MHMIIHVNVQVSTGKSVILSANVIRVYIHSPTTPIFCIVGFLRRDSVTLYCITVSIFWLCIANVTEEQPSGSGFR